jgi:hypothetical protein
MHNYFNHALIGDLKTRVFNGMSKLSKRANILSLSSAM